MRRTRKRGGRFLKMIGMKDMPRELIALFEPQAEQLGIQLEQYGGIWTGAATGGAARGTMWLHAPSPYCLVLSHDVTPCNDMPLFEGSLGPYVCVCTLGEDALACSKDCGLAIRPIGRARHGCHTQTELATFVEREPRSLSSSLVAGHTYRSQSIIMLPEFFDELDRRYPGEYRGLFPLFDGAWGAAAERAIRRALADIPARPPLHPGGELGLLSTVTALIASLSADRPPAAAEPETEALALRAQELISEAIEAGNAPPSIDSVAKRLYVSRSRLCETFRHVTGQSMGSYGRQLRLERAYRLLEDERLTIGEVAGLLGYPTPSAFCHAFVSALGMAPKAWREASISTS